MPWVCWEESIYKYMNYSKITAPFGAVIFLNNYLLQDFKFIEVILWKLFYALLAVLQQPKPLS